LEAGQDVCFGDLRTVLGMPDNTFVGPIEGFYKTLHPDDRERVVHSIEEATRNGVMYEEEFRVQRRDGQEPWVASKGRAYSSPGRQPVRMLGVATDTTDRKLAEQALLRKESELAEAQRLASIGSWQWDARTQNVTWSDELYRIAGLKRSSPVISGENHSKL